MEMIETNPAKQTSKSKRLTALPWIIWGLAATFYFYEYFLKVSPNVMAPDLMRAFSINAAQFGNLAAMYFYIYAFMQIPVGILLDRFGPRILLTFAAAICALGSFIFGTADTLFAAELGRFLIGLGAAFAPVSCMKIAANWFPLRRFAFLVGLMVTIGTLGAISAHAPLALLVKQTDWRTSMHIVAAIGAFICVLIWAVVRNKPKASTDDFPTTPMKSKDLVRGLTAVLKNKQTWLIALYGGLMYMPSEVLGGLWGVTYLTEVYGISRVAAGGMISFLFIGWVFGAPFWGMVSDRIGRRLPPMIIGNIGLLLSLLVIIYLPVPILVMNITLFFLGFSSSGFLPAFSIVREINLPTHNATALGFMNTFNMAIPAVMYPSVGVVLDYVWVGIFEEGAPFYSLHSFHIALSLLPICIALSLFTLPFVKETFCQEVKH